MGREADGLHHSVACRPRVFTQFPNFVGRLIASKTFACRVFYGRQTPRRADWDWDGMGRDFHLDLEYDSDTDSDSDGQRIRAVVIHLTCTLRSRRLRRRRLPLSAASCSCNLGQVCRFWRPRHQHQLPGKLQLPLQLLLLLQLVHPPLGSQQSPMKDRRVLRSANRIAKKFAHVSHSTGPLDLGRES